ncbi:MAG: hypothetical protein EZS28_012328 [Streblomastix strix]|uniref:Transmembrane protein n=1 Tax=Streblomastix strix TaxID=222440 RepID=A0A5J4WB25_9EUKA|nr:MAG: hypothetical protein EZS28_012328 [Streblomastix strix]
MANSSVQSFTRRSLITVLCSVAAVLAFGHILTSTLFVDYSSRAQMTLTLMNIIFSCFVLTGIVFCIYAASVCFSFQSHHMAARIGTGILLCILPFLIYCGGYALIYSGSEEIQLLDSDLQSDQQTNANYLPEPNVIKIVNRDIVPTILSQAQIMLIQGIGSFIVAVAITLILISFTFSFGWQFVKPYRILLILLTVCILAILCFLQLGFWSIFPSFNVTRKRGRLDSPPFSLSLETQPTQDEEQSSVPQFDRFLKWGITLMVFFILCTITFLVLFIFGLFMLSKKVIRKRNKLHIRITKEIENILKDQKDKELQTQDQEINNQSIISREKPSKKDEMKQNYDKYKDLAYRQLYDKRSKECERREKMLEITAQFILEREFQQKEMKRLIEEREYGLEVGMTEEKKKNEEYEQKSKKLLQVEQDDQNLENGLEERIQLEKESPEQKLE